MSRPNEQLPPRQQYMLTSAEYDNLHKLFGLLVRAEPDVSEGSEWTYRMYDMAKSLFNSRNTLRGRAAKTDRYEELITKAEAQLHLFFGPESPQNLTRLLDMVEAYESKRMSLESQARSWVAVWQRINNHHQLNTYGTTGKERVINAIDKLVGALERFGICPKCYEEIKESGDVPFASCRCGTREWTAPLTPLMRLRVLEAQPDPEVDPSREERAAMLLVGDEVKGRFNPLLEGRAKAIFETRSGVKVAIEHPDGYCSVFPASQLSRKEGC